MQKPQKVVIKERGLQKKEFPKKYEDQLKAFRIIKIRMKISYMALMRKLTIKELFLNAILDQCGHFFESNKLTTKCKNCPNK